MKTEHPRIRIGLVGLKGSGKTTVSHLMRLYGFSVQSFASPIKLMCRELIAPNTFPGDPRLEYISGSKKEEVIPHLGVTGRHLMQTLGTEWGRGMIHPDIWINTLINGNVFQTFEKVVVDDVRFHSEAKSLRDNGAKFIRIIRPGVACDGHISEVECMEIDVDHTIANDGPEDGKGGLGTKIEIALKSLGLLSF